MTVLISAFLIFVGVVDATFSIVGTNSINRQIGGAGASCVANADIFESLYVGVPNHGVLHTQAVVIDHESDVVMAAKTMLEGDAPLELILETMLALDPGEIGDGAVVYTSTTLRQYGIANFSSDVGFTGSNLFDLYLNDLGYGITENFDNGGSFSPYTHHAQANAVVDGTVNSMRLAFVGVITDPEIPEICDLAGRLMAAMQTVVLAGHGDVRCSAGNTTATGAFLHVDNPDGTEYVHLNIVGDGSFEPVLALRESFDVWRAENPCPTSDTAAPVTMAPVTMAPVTSTPVSAAPVTSAPVGAPDATGAPVTAAPVLDATSAPITGSPATTAPATETPVAPSDSTMAPVTSAPVTSAPVTAAPVPPATFAPVSPAPTPSGAFRTSLIVSFIAAVTTAISI
jgi:hypothetical protein